MLKLLTKEGREKPIKMRYWQFYVTGKTEYATPKIYITTPWYYREYEVESQWFPVLSPERVQTIDLDMVVHTEEISRDYGVAIDRFDDMWCIGITWGHDPSEFVYDPIEEERFYFYKRFCVPTFDKLKYLLRTKNG